MDFEEFPERKLTELSWLLFLFVSIIANIDKECTQLFLYCWVIVCRLNTAINHRFGAYLALWFVLGLLTAHAKYIDSLSKS